MIAQKLIRAPFAGRLGMRQIELGQFSTPARAIVTLTDLTQLYVNFTLPSRMRSRSASGSRSMSPPTRSPAASSPRRSPTIEPQIRADTRTMTVQATMANPDEALLPGMFVNAAVVLPAEPDQVVLAGDRGRLHALRRQRLCRSARTAATPSGKPVLKAFRTPVKTGARWSSKVAILSGVKPGDRVVAAGQVKLQNGAAVDRHRQPAAAAAGQPDPN